MSSTAHHLREIPMRDFPYTFIMLGLLAIFGFNVLAQSATATLAGSVSDENGARVPSAKIVVTNTGTGIEQNVMTDKGGGFVFPFLAPGRYEIKVQRHGFATAE